MKKLLFVIGLSSFILCGCSVLETVYPTAKEYGTGLLKEELAKKVEEGELTQEQADALLDLADNASKAVEKEYNSTTDSTEE